LKEQELPSHFHAASVATTRRALRIGRGVPGMSATVTPTRALITKISAGGAQNGYFTVKAKTPFNFVPPPSVL